MNLEIKKIAGYIMLFFPLTVIGQDEPHLNVGMAIQYDDNSRRRDRGDIVDDTKVSFDGNASYKKVEDWYRFNVNYSTARTSYVENSYNDHSATNGSGDLVLGKGSSWITWHLNNSEQSTILDVLNPDTPDNQSQRSTFSTGPHLVFPLSPRSKIDASYVYTKVAVEGAGANSERKLSSVNYSRGLSPLTNVSVAVRHSIIEPEYDQLNLLADANDYEQNSVSVQVTRAIKNGNLSVSLGQTEVKGQSSLPSTTSDEYSLSLNRRFSIGSFTLSLAKSISDSGLGQMTTGINADIGDSTFDIQENNNWNLNYSSALLPGSLVFTLDSGFVKTESITREQKQKRFQNRIGLTHNLTEKTNVTGGISHKKNSVNESEDSKSLEYSLGIQHRVSNKVSIGCNVKNESGSGISEYDAVIVGCDANWRIY